MPTDVPEVHVTSDPLVVFTFVALFAGAMVLALLLAAAFTPGSGGIPDDPPAEAHDASPAAAGPPWSTAPVNPGLARKERSEKPANRD
jgi:hypothetical protein